MPGVYSLTFKDRRINIKDREIFVTGDEKLIKFFETDPEIVEFKPEDELEAPKVYSDLSKDELKAELTKRKLEADSIEKAIEVLKADDKEKSSSKNDPGEQTPE